MKKLTAILMGLSLLLLAACGGGGAAPAMETSAPAAEATAPAAEATAPDLVYVSLGDSIAKGYGLEDARTETYCYVLAELLAADGRTAEVWREGVNGDTSGDLRELLEAGRAEGLADADLITISIGANNILLPAVSFLRDAAAFEQGKAGLSAADVTASFNAFLTAADEGIAAMREDLPAIIDLIREVNPDAQIVWLTVYNPYRGTGASFSVGGFPIQFEALSETKIELLNDFIRESAGEQGYAVADVYAAFAASEGAHVNAAEGTALFAYLLDPHPNAAGHRLIAETIYGSLG